MNRTRPFTPIRRLACALAGLATALLATAAAAPAAFARPIPPAPDRDATVPPHPPLPPAHVHYPVHHAPVPAPVHTVVIGGMPGWQIALIVVAAAVVAAAVAVFLDRARAARRHQPALSA